MFEINLWISHAGWLLAKRLEYNGRVERGEKLGELAAEDVFPNYEMEFATWQRHIWGNAGLIVEAFVDTYRGAGWQRLTYCVDSSVPP